MSGRIAMCCENICLQFPVDVRVALYGSIFCVL